MKNEYKIFLKRGILSFCAFLISLVVSIVLILKLGEKTLNGLLIPICMVFILTPFVLGEYNICKIKSIWKPVRFLLYYQMVLVVIGMVGMIVYLIWNGIFTTK